MKVLIVEDEEKASRFLSKAFSENGFVVDALVRGEEALQAVETGRYDLIVADVMVPGIDGISLTRELRRRGCLTPVIILTARDAVHDRISGIEAGAQVYLVKPFSVSEVLAYSKSLTQRKPLVGQKLLSVGDLEIDLDRQRVRRREKMLELTAKEFSLLSLLARREGQILSRSVIAEEVWGINFDSGTNVVDVHIRRLRAKVDEPFDSHLIWTVRGAGYVMENRGGSSNSGLDAEDQTQ